MNDYQPWRELDMSETEYFKKRYINERIGAQKLIEMLTSISRRVQTSHPQFGWADLHEIGSWADSAIAEYETDRD